MTNKYQDIINLPHYISKKRPQMSIYNRAAQFAPFRALTGYDDAINQTNKILEQKIILGDDATIEITNTLNFIHNNIKSNLTISVTYFVADNKRYGGKYISKQGIVKNIDDIDKKITFIDGSKIEFDDIYKILII